MEKFNFICNSIISLDMNINIPSRHSLCIYAYHIHLLYCNTPTRGYTLCTIHISLLLYCNKHPTRGYTLRTIETRDDLDIHKLNPESVSLYLWIVHENHKSYSQGVLWYVKIWSYFIVLEHDPTVCG